MYKLLNILLISLLLAGSPLTNAQADDDSNGPGAVTLWWVIFNKPDACVANPGAAEQCGSVDVFGERFLESVASGSPDPSLIAPNLESGLAVLYATGGETTGSGRVRLAAAIYRSAAGGGLDLAGENVVDPLGLGRAFENPEAEVHLVVRDHGRRVRDGLLAQITNFLEPYCSDPTLLFFAGENTCADVQFAVFAPTESGEDAVLAFGNPPERVHRASAYLYRNSDMLVAVVETRVRGAHD